MSKTKTTEEKLSEAAQESANSATIIADQDGDKTPFLSLKAVKEDQNLRNYLDVSIIKDTSNYKVRVIKADPFQTLMLLRDSKILELEQYADLTEDEFDKLSLSIKTDITLMNRDYADKLLSQFIQIPKEDNPENFVSIAEVLPLDQLDEELRELLLQAYYEVNPSNSKGGGESELDTFPEEDRSEREGNG